LPASAASTNSFTVAERSCGLFSRDIEASLEAQSCNRNLIQFWGGGHRGRAPNGSSDSYPWSIPHPQAGTSPNTS
jgi:hypothetical protein